MRQMITEKTRISILSNNEVFRAKIKMLESLCVKLIRLTYSYAFTLDAGKYQIRIEGYVAGSISEFRLNSYTIGRFSHQWKWEKTMLCYTYAHSPHVFQLRQFDETVLFILDDIIDGLNDLVSAAEDEIDVEETYWEAMLAL